MITRRQFLKNSTLTVGCISAGGLSVFTGCKAVAYVSHELQADRIIVKKADVGENRYVVVDVEKLPAPIYLSKTTDESYSAVLMKCTHRGCEVMPLGDILHCPCHGSEYTGDGKVIQSPATENLRQFTVTTDSENIYIA